MAEQAELVRRELQLQWEIASHELECLADDDAPGKQIDAKLEECRLIMARQDDMARRDGRLDAGRGHGSRRDHGEILG